PFPHVSRELRGCRNSRTASRRHRSKCSILCNKFSTLGRCKRRKKFSECNKPLLLLLLLLLLPLPQRRRAVVCLENSQLASVQVSIKRSRWARQLQDSH